MSDVKKHYGVAFAGEDWWLPRYDLKSGFAKWAGRPLTWSTVNDPPLLWDGWKHYTPGKDIFDNENGAAAKALEQRSKKRASLIKQIAKLDKLDASF